MTLQKSTHIPLLSPLDDFLLRDLNPKEIALLARTGSTGNRMVKDFLRRAYRIERFLLPFFTENQYNILRNCQAKTDALIVGSVPSQFLDRSAFLDWNLNILVNRQHLQLLHDFILKCDYTFRSPSDRTYEQETSYFTSCFDSGFLLPLHTKYPGTIITLMYRHRNNGRTVLLTSTVFNPLQALLTVGFSCMLNVITYAHAISLYPRATFIDRVTYVATAHNKSNCSLKRKYVARGWSTLTREQAMRRIEFTKVRRVGDRFSWVLPLRHRSPPPRPPHSDPVFIHTWKMATPSDTNNAFSFIIIKPLSFATDICFCGKNRVTMNKYRTASGLTSAKLIEMSTAIVPSGHWNTFLSEQDYIIIENSKHTSTVTNDPSKFL